MARSSLAAMCRPPPSAAVGASWSTAINYPSLSAAHLVLHGESWAVPSQPRANNSPGYKTPLFWLCTLKESSEGGQTQPCAHVPGEKMSGLKRMSKEVSLVEPTALQAFRITSLLLGSTGAGREQNTNQCGRDSEYK